MGKIYYMMGKSSSGKDTLYKELCKRCLQLRNVILYTTRPPREGEKDGREYFFVSESTLEEYEKAGKVIERRVYTTMYGDWFYATIDDGQVELSKADYLMTGTLESYNKVKKYYGRSNVEPVYIEVEDGERLCRALKREREQTLPRYDEMCRRFLADQKDFSEEKIKEAGIIRRYSNDDKIRCLEEIIGEIRHGKL